MYALNINGFLKFKDFASILGIRVTKMRHNTNVTHTTKTSANASKPTNYYGIRSQKYLTAQKRQTKNEKNKKQKNSKPTKCD